MSKAGYLQIKLSEMEDKVLALTNLLDNKEEELERKSKEIQKQIKDTLDILKPYMDLTKKLEFDEMNKGRFQQAIAQDEKIEKYRTSLHTEIGKKMNKIYNLLLDKLYEKQDVIAKRLLENILKFKSIMREEIRDVANSKYIDGKKQS